MPNYFCGVDWIESARWFFENVKCVFFLVSHNIPRNMIIFVSVDLVGFGSALAREVEETLWFLDQSEPASIQTARQKSESFLHENKTAAVFKLVSGFHLYLQSYKPLQQCSQTDEPKKENLLLFFFLKSTYIKPKKRRRKSYKIMQEKRLQYQFGSRSLKGEKSNF